MKKVFEAHPKVNKIFKVGNVPFLKKVDALNFAKGDESKVEIVVRSNKKAKTTDEKTDSKADNIKALKAQAKDLKIKSYGKMNEIELKEAIAKATAGSAEKFED